ncbi:MAG: hypothetical protein LBL07_06500 [Tannerella sp.]|nr:hypothetical protein [Tannerella sp.]
MYIDTQGILWIVCEDRILAGSFDEAGNYSLLRQIPLSSHPGSASITKIIRETFGSACHTNCLSYERETYPARLKVSTRETLQKYIPCPEASF